jgi:hypothetical protein
MSSVKTFYAIVDYAGHRGTAVEYVNENTTSLNDIWMSMYLFHINSKMFQLPRLSLLVGRMRNLT